MTPQDVARRVFAEQSRDMRELENIAQLAAWLLAGWVGDKAPSRDELLGRVERL